VTSMTSVDELAYENDIQKYILEHPETFHVSGNNSVILEKKLPGRSRGSVIADVVIFSSELGGIGIEIKTAHDTTKRLKHQLETYALTFDYVYVFCADNQYEHVMDIINKNKMDRIGVITYGEKHGNIYPGEVKKAAYLRPNPRNLYRMMWKKELVAINNQITSSKELAVRKKTELGLKGDTLGDIDDFGKALSKSFMQQQGIGVTKMDGKASNVNGRTNKEILIGSIFKRLGTLGATQLALDLWVNGIHHPEKVIRYYHFAKEVPKFEYEEADRLP